MSIILFTKHIYAQVWYTGMPDPILNVTFGDGTPNPGPALATGKTGYTYTTSLCPGLGEYTIARNNISCYPANGWDRITLDHTFRFNEVAYEGYIMLVNTYTLLSRNYYVDTVRGLCDNASYLFTAAVASLGDCVNGPFGMNIRFIVETLSGVELANSFSPQSFTALRGSVGIYFDLPAGETGVVLKLKNRFVGYQDCGQKLSIDDIQLRPSDANAPVLKASFVNSTDLMKSVCYETNSSLPMEVKLSRGSFANPSFQWQQSVDRLTWVDIPGETNQFFAPVFSIPGMYYFRARASETGLINNPYCSMVSNYNIVQVDGIPKNILITSNSPVCSGSRISFNAVGAASYTWTGPNNFYDVGPYPGINQAMLADSGMYYVDITSAGGCKGFDSTYVSVIGTDVSVSADTSICKGNRANLRVTGGNGFAWTPSANLSNPNSNFTTASPEVTTIYTVTVTDNSGCTDTASIRVKVLNSIEVKAVPVGPDYFCRPSDTATFVNQGTGSIVNWAWDFGDGKVSDQEDPPLQHFTIPAHIKNYMVRLAVMDSAGCTDTAYHHVNVADNCYIAVPNAFTPNGDGLNDYLYPVNAYKAKDLIFRVFNRSGRLIFESREWTRKWDGTINGVLQSTGVYIWSLEYTEPGQKRIRLNGTATLIR